TGSNTSAIQSEATARANADTALGKRVDTVQATVGENTAAIQTTATAGTTNDGKTMNAMWSTKASINDVVGGFGLMAEKDPDGVTRIKFLVDADIFAVLGRNGDKRAPFVIKDGVVYMNKLLLDDAEIGGVIAKYINVQHLVGTLIEGGSFRGGDLWIGENPSGNWNAYGKRWNAGINGSGIGYFSDINVTGGNFTGTVNANAGTFNNVTIAENCNVLGTIYAGKIVGDVAAIKSLYIPTPNVSVFYVDFIVLPAPIVRSIVISGVLITAKGEGDTEKNSSSAGFYLNGQLINSQSVSAIGSKSVNTASVGSSSTLPANTRGEYRVRLVQYYGGVTDGVDLSAATVVVTKLSSGTFG
ncbi:MAG: phage tail tip fiber protein, partial [Plesiomonas sp.]